MKIIGHRGAKGLAPENTVSSIKKAIQHETDEIEFDVRVTADKVVVLIHDPVIHTPDGQTYPVHASTYRQLKQLKPELPTLEQIMHTAGKTQRLVIEIKPNEQTGPITKLLRQALNNGWPADRLLIASFDQKILLKVQKDLPELGYVVNEGWSGVRATYRARQLGTRRITMRSWWLWPGFIRMMHSSGYQLSAYTLNNPKKARAWAKAGLFGVVTDFPDLFV